jgi:hypothetical protein
MDENAERYVPNAIYTVPDLVQYLEMRVILPGLLKKYSNYDTEFGEMNVFLTSKKRPFEFIRRQDN